MERRVLCNDLQEPEGPVCLPDGQIYVVEMAHARNCVSRIDAHGQRHQLVHSRRDVSFGLLIEGLARC